MISFVKPDSAAELCRGVMACEELSNLRAFLIELS